MPQSPCLQTRSHAANTAIPGAGMLHDLVHVQPYTLRPLACLTLHCQDLALQPVWPAPDPEASRVTAQMLLKCCCWCRHSCAGQQPRWV